MMKVSKRILILLCGILLLPVTAQAAPIYEGYVYNSLFSPVRSINGYAYVSSFDGLGTEAGRLQNPEDLFVADDDTLYVVDSGNNRILHLDQSFNLIKIVGDPEGVGKLNGPKGVFAALDGTIYVADTLNRRIVIYDARGSFVKEIAAPKSALLGESFVYSPSKLVVDRRGLMLIISEGSDKGLLQIDAEGRFMGFFGSNHVPFSWSKIILDFIATDEQKRQLASLRPPSFSNVALGADGSIYTTTYGIFTNQIKRLSAVGADTLNRSGENRYGDYWMPTHDFVVENEAFTDVTVSTDGLITTIDQAFGKVYQYDKNGELLFIFGGKGNQDGLFITPTSIASTSKQHLYISDGSRNRIDYFRPTPFGEKVHYASALYANGQFAEAKKPWEEVLKMNRNYELAYTAIGKSLYKSGDYREAMRHFKISREREEYSKAFVEYRKDFVRGNFHWIALALIMLPLLKRVGTHFIRMSATRNNLSRGREG